jgi:hypothetical protein
MVSTGLALKILVCYLLHISASNPAVSKSGVDGSALTLFLHLLGAAFRRRQWQIEIGDRDIVPH